MVQLIVGLANPGRQYEATRHNAGAWFVNELTLPSQFLLDPKLKAKIAQISLNGHSCKIAIPSTYMNESGFAVSAIARFYKIPAEKILVAHDEIDFAAGICRLKFAGGEGGHNGLRSIVQHLGTKNFYRLRIGVGHPGDSKEVANYVLNSPTKSELILIEAAMQHALAVMPDILAGNFERAMHLLHTQGG